MFKVILNTYPFPKSLPIKINNLFSLSNRWKHWICKQWFVVVAWKYFNEWFWSILRYCKQLFQSYGTSPHSSVQSTSYSLICLLEGLDVLRCEGLHGLEVLRLGASIVAFLLGKKMVFQLPLVKRPLEGNSLNSLLFYCSWK